MSSLRRRAFFMRHVFGSTKGFTLVEMVIVMAIFMTIIIISSQAFNTILSVSTQQTKSAESDTQGILGLEMLRVDLEHAGYGLPWVLSFEAEFEEAQAATGDLAPGVDPKSFNDMSNASSDTSRVPRAVQSGVSSAGSDYLVLKSTILSTSDVPDDSAASKKWAYVEGVGESSTLKAWGTDNFVSGEKVVTIDSRTKLLISKPVTPPDEMAAGDFSYAITGSEMTPLDGFRPPSDSAVYLVYGVSKTNNLRVPYNRIDYYVKRPTDTSEFPARCAPGTGILYKAVMKHSDGKFDEFPLLECVADMQVVFQLDTNGDGGADSFTTHNGLSNLSAKQIREQLKMVNIYLVAHEGGKDNGFKYSKGKDLAVGEGFGRTLDLEALFGGSSESYLNYRWKSYKLSVTPKNINY